MIALQLALPSQHRLDLELAPGQCGRVALDAEAGELHDQLTTALLTALPPRKDSPLPPTAHLCSAGGLLSNLRVWENITLVVCYHQQRPAPVFEAAVRQALQRLLVPEVQWPDFLGATVAQLTPVQRKQAGLLKILLHQPSLVVVEHDFFEDVSAGHVEHWLSLLCADNRAVLVLSAASLPGQGPVFRLHPPAGAAHHPVT